MNSKSLIYELVRESHTKMTSLDDSINSDALRCVRVLIPEIKALFFFSEKQLCGY